MGVSEATGRGINRLSDRAVRAFIAQTRAGTAAKRKLSDGAGLYLIITPAGSAAWRLKYRLAGRERVYSIGLYPEVSLANAREARDSARALIRDGHDPVTERRIVRAGNTAASGASFADVAMDWLDKQRPDWSGIHYDTSRRALERDVLPALGRLPIGSITPVMVAGVVEDITRRGVRDTAKKVLQHVTGIFRFAQARGLCRDNPATPAAELLPRRREPKPRPALLKAEDLRDVLRRADLAALSPSVRLAQRVVAFTAQRIGNVVNAPWSEFDLEASDPTWRIPRARMKVRDRLFDHVVILGPTIAAELTAWRKITGPSGYAFPSPTGNDHVGREALEKVYRVTLGLAKVHSLHGWRAAFATLARDHGFARDAVELTLDHVHDTTVARAYDRGERRSERIELMRWWNQLLSE